MQNLPNLDHLYSAVGTEGCTKMYELRLTRLKIRSLHFIVLSFPHHLSLSIRENWLNISVDLKGGGGGREGKGGVGEGKGSGGVICSCRRSVIRNRTG